MSADKHEKTILNSVMGAPGGQGDGSLERREFIKRAAVGAGAVAMGMVAMGCSSSSGTASSSQLGTGATVPTASAWKFAVMGDTQWIAGDDGLNPNTCAVGLITQLNSQFVAQGVKFVVQVGDLADQGYGSSSEAGYATTANVAEDTRALFSQALFNAGIGFFPVRGNHDDLNTTATEFATIYPQTQTGVMNGSSVYSHVQGTVSAAYNAMDANQPIPADSGSSFTLGSNFGTIGSPDTDLAGLSYGFDYSNARLVFIDQFTTPNSVDVGGAAHSTNASAALQQPWITSALSGRTSGAHAFVFAHKGIITQQHVDVLFGADPSDASSAGINPFINSMVANKARLFFCGHDHIHNRSIVKNTSDPTKHITHQLCQSVSSKFYTPNEDNPIGNGAVPKFTSNDAYYCSGLRQTQLSQELYSVGFYIVTVDGANVTVDYYSAPAYPIAGSSTEDVITATPTLNFTKQETTGYSLKGKQFIVASGESYTGVKDTGPSGTVAQILSGTNSNANSDRSGRIYSNDVNTGWITETSGTASDVLVLWGMARNLGSGLTDQYVLSMTYDASKGSAFVLATPDAAGNWVNAVAQNSGGTTQMVKGAWKSSYGLGTYGIDTSAGTVWAVLNYNGYFAAVQGA
jgi:hypothetical protein